MKRFFYLTLILLACIIMSTSVNASDILMPKREMRSAWVATVWQLDWPRNKITETGNASDIARQKKDMITLLDSMAVNNMNAINFQVRSRTDALYKSSFEPWSSDLVAERGMNPGYDPLQFVIEECHKRGMECHAWVNPYRYESVTGAWGSGANEYRSQHPEWIMDVNGASILNPGNPEVTQRIVDVCKEIISNYDVDGILYDDYFYLSGTPTSADSNLYDQYTQQGGTLSQNDWRRDNVNKMVKAVYDMIQTVKPWVRFGVSPAGVAATNSAVANKYGVEPCPSGSDWQYNDIYSDPLAWISQRSLDFISPQVYWTIGYTTADYSKISPWWAMVANKFGRHFYTSHSISSLSASSKDALRNGTSPLERKLMAQTKASGPNNNTFAEFENQVKLNRECTLNDAPGSIFYSCKYMYSTAPLFAHHLKKTVFSRPAIMPLMSYKAGHNPGNVKNLTLTDNILSWTGYSNVRYTVYAVPTSIQQASFKSDAQYLLGTSYETTFEIPKKYREGYQFAVSVLDRYANEYSPIFVGATEQTLPAATLISPAFGTTAVDPFFFEWNAVAGATSYIVEVATDTDFNNMIATLPSTTTKVSSVLIENLKAGIDHYWRVRSCANNYQDGISATIKFVPKLLVITAPENNATDVSTTSTITWVAVEGLKGLLEISTNPNFIEGSIVLSVESNTGSYTLPPFTLNAYTKYYARVTMGEGDDSKTTTPVGFTTEAMEATTPVITHPVQGGTLYADEKITIERQAGANQFSIDVDASTVFGRTRYTAALKDFNYQSIEASGIKVSSKNLENGKTYYLRARANYLSSEGSITTPYTDIIEFTYSSSSGVNGTIADATVEIIGGNNPVLIINTSKSGYVIAHAISTVGIVEDVLYNGETNNTLELPLEHLQNGVYLITVKIDGVIKTLKFIK